ncbi:MAG: phosphoenolpyruvate carboxylase, partial [Actinomycetota bacterium]|nr:phosphoenolpyruvate carboxylase [Actinomycetota bacterium]
MTAENSAPTLPTELHPGRRSPDAENGGRSTSERSFADDETLLGEVLTQVIEASEGRRAIELHHRAVSLAKRSRGGDQAAAHELAALVRELPLREMQMLVRSLTRWFELLNLAEDNDRVRRARSRQAQSKDTPGGGPVRDVMDRLAAGGTGSDQLEGALAQAELRLVVTAHPSEARRAATVEKLVRIFGCLRRLDERHAPAGAQAEARQALAAAVQELWASDELRSVSTTVGDEVSAGLVYFTSTLGDVVARFYRRLEAAVAQAFPAQEVAVPSFLTFGSWIGGDRDGNPNVTPAVTAQTLDQMRAACLRFLEERMAGVRPRVSLSTRLIGDVPELEPLLSAGRETFPELAAELEQRHPDEPYTRALGLMEEGLRVTRTGLGGYSSPAALLDDLHLVERSLKRRGGAFIAEGALRELIRQVEVFGFHFARLDIRDHAERHRAALAEVLAALGVHDHYASLTAEERAALLAREIASRRPLVPSDVSGLSEETREVIETFRTLHSLLTSEHRGAVETYGVSGTSCAADVLEVLLLMKESRLARAGGEAAMLRIAPLFESAETLSQAAETMRRVLAEPVYREALRAVGDQQEVMIGYSDSNKGAGYVASSWATHSAQVELARTFREHGLSWMFFHGRGGSVGRGGGPSNVAIRGQPQGTVAGRLKITEQGEVLSGKYSLAEIEERELELVAGAMVERTVAGTTPAAPEHYEAVVESMARQSSAAYRELVFGDPDFDTFFHEATPIDEISRLRLGSRPASRKVSGSVEDYRAIPWVFAWTQARVVLPAWYGLGTALAAAREEVGVKLLREMAREWPFFGGLLSNAEMAAAKADLGIGRRYAELVKEPEIRERVWKRIEAELVLTCDEILHVNGGQRLLDHQPVLQRSIDRRNPYADPLSFVQLELLRRLRADGADPDDPELVRASLVAINGIAGAMRNT